MSSVKQASSSKQGIAYELHKPARKIYTRRKTTVKGLNDLWQVDLVEMQPYAKFNKGYRYILTVIDVLSKFAYALPVKSKTSQDVKKAMESIIKTSGVVPTHIQSDQGLEFFNKEFTSMMKKYKIKHYHTYSPLKAAVVERFNRTIKNWMWREFSAQGSYKWLDMLPELVDKYNSRVHRTINMKPVDVKPKHESSLLDILNYRPNKPITKHKYEVGDKVRISKQKMIFSKGYTPSWTTEIFTIDAVLPTQPETYLLKDWLGEPVLGSFYKEELAKTKYPDTYLVEKILRYSKDKKQAYVKFLGFSQPSWINSSDVE